MVAEGQHVITTDRLDSLRMLLERGRIVLRGRTDADGRYLSMQVANLLVALCNARTEFASQRVVTELAINGDDLIDQVRAYCDRYRIRFLTMSSYPTLVMPMEDIHEEIRASIAALPVGTTTLPPALAQVVAEAQILVPEARATADQQTSRVVDGVMPAGSAWTEPEFEDD